METTTTMASAKHTNRELADLMQGLVDVKDLKGVKFSLQVSKNMKLIKSELTNLEDASQPTPEFLQLAKLVQEIEASKSKTDEEKEEEINKIEADNTELVEHRKEQIEEFNLLLLEETELNLFKVSESDLPSDITTTQLLNINQIIKE